MQLLMITGLTALAIPMVLGAWHIGRGVLDGIKEHRRTRRG
jgi:hypothetical protein